MKTLTIGFLASLLVAGGSIAACGGSTSDNPPAPDAGTTDDASVDAVDDTFDAGDPIDPNYPADHTAIPLVDYNGGRVLSAVKVVTVTFTNDDTQMVSDLQKFGDTITSTPWWTAVSAEYCAQPNNKPCIGPGTAGGHVEVSDTPSATYTDSSQGGASTIQDFIKAKVADSTFPAPTDQTLYAIYFPTNVTIDLDGAQSCGNGGFGAYHNTLMLPDADGGSIPVAYAIIPRCGSEKTTTVSASHEFIEAATDPDVGLNSLGYYMGNQLWAFAGGEVGDLCVDFTGGNDTYVESTFTVQRSWSNASAKASHDPCVPIPQGEVYFNSAPRKETIILKKVGDKAVVDIDAFSDGPTSNWSLSAVDFAQFQGGSADVSFAFDKTSVNNGSHAQLTVTLTKVPAQGQDLFGIVSKSGQTTRFWPVLVISQ